MSEAPARPSRFGPVIDRLWTTIGERKARADKLVANRAEHGASPAKETDQPRSYTVELLTAPPDTLNKKIAEEATEVILSAKEYETARAQGSEGVSVYGTGRDHLIYELGDLTYHLLVLCAQWDVTPDDIASELERRF